MTLLYSGAHMPSLLAALQQNSELPNPFHSSWPQILNKSFENLIKMATSFQAMSFHMLLTHSILPHYWCKAQLLWTFLRLTSQYLIWHPHHSVYF